MMIIDAVEPHPIISWVRHRRDGHLELMLGLLHALAQAQEPYADLTAIEQGRPAPTRRHPLKDRFGRRIARAAAAVTRR